MSFGGALSFGKTDHNCQELEIARSLALYSTRVAYCKQMLQLKEVRKAGITLEECIGPEPAPVVVQPAPTPVVPPPTIIVVPTPVAAPTPAPVIPPTHEQSFLLGSCRLTAAKTTNACLRVLDSAILRLENRPEAKLRVTGAISAATLVEYLRHRGIDASRIEQTYADDQNSTVSLALVWQSAS